MDAVPSSIPTDPSAVYTSCYALLTDERGVLSRRRRFLRLALLVAGAVMVLLAGGTLYQNASAWPVGIAFCIVFALLQLFLHTGHKHDRLGRLIHLYARGLGRLDGTATQSGHTGEPFHAVSHLYDRDLSILGPDSLFGLLATVRTGVGQRGLAYDLLHAHTREATLARQQAVRELAPNLNLREDIQLLGTNDFHQVAASFFDGWLDEPPPTFHRLLRPILVTTSTLLIAGLLAGLWHLLSWTVLAPNLLLLVAAQSALGFYLRPRVLPVLTGAANLANQMRMFEQGLTLLQKTSFDAPHLLALQQRSLQPQNAARALRKVQSQFVIVEQRTKEWFLIASLLTNAGTHAALSIAAWKRNHAAAMKQWLATWAEFESLNALATYAFEHPDNTYPLILPSGTSTFEATALAHPLLPANAVANDIAVNASQSLYLISGSNMAGKSTLLRSIGLNAVLAAAGAPIRAAHARISPLALGASLSLNDSLAEGKSKFLAEVERLHAILKLAERGTPVLFLIDEIFSGTNSLDRRVAAEAVASALIARGGIGALSTHDLTLTEMAANPALRAVNLHMASPDPADPLAFDYRLKPGINPTSNALAILRLIGINISS